MILEPRTIDQSVCNRYFIGMYWNQRNVVGQWQTTTVHISDSGSYVRTYTLKYTGCENITTRIDLEALM